MSLIWQQLLGILQPVVLALAGWGLNSLRNWISTRTTNEALNALIARMNDAILDAVKTVYQLLVDGMKKTGGGVLSSAQQAEAKAKALAMAKLNMGPLLLNQIKEAKGYTDAQLDEMLSGQIEKAIHDNKAARGGSINLGAGFANVIPPSAAENMKALKDLVPVVEKPASPPEPKLMEKIE